MQTSDESKKNINYGITTIVEVSLKTFFGVAVVLCSQKSYLSH